MQPSTWKKGRHSICRLKQKLARGYASKGSNLEDEKYRYYLTLLQNQQGLQSLEEKDIMIKSFFREVKKEDNIMDLAGHQVVSRMFDKMLPLSSTEDILYIIDAFSEDLRIMCCHPFASHVMQTLLIEGFKRCQVIPEKSCTDPESETEYPNTEKHMTTEEQQIKFIAFLEKGVKFTLNNFETFVFDPYASHVVRTVLEVCSGVTLDSSMKSKNAQTNRVLNDKPTSILNVPKEFKNFPSFIRKLDSIGQLGDMVANNGGSAVLQSLLAISSKLKEKNDLVSIIINRGLLSVPRSCETVDTINPMFQYYSSVYLLEELLQYATVKQQELLYDTCFHETFSELLTHRMGNVAVSALLKECKMKDKFDHIFEVTINNLESVIELGYYKVVQSLVMACRTLQMNQKQCIKKLMTFFDCTDEDKQELFAPLLLFMIPRSTYEEFIEKGIDSLMPTKLTGTLIVEELLRYNNPSKIVKSILSMQGDHIMKIACDVRACHIFDVFMEEPCVGVRSKEQLVDKLKGQFALMARDKFGSRALETIFENSTKLKNVICLELSEKESMICETMFGKIICDKFKIRLFKKNDKSDWAVIQRQQENKRKFLQEFLGSTEKDSAGRKRKVKETEDDEEGELKNQGNIEDNSNLRQYGDIKEQESSEKESSKKKRKEEKKQNVEATDFNSLFSGSVSSSSKKKKKRAKDNESIVPDIKLSPKKDGYDEMEKVKEVIMPVTDFSWSYGEDDHKDMVKEESEEFSHDTPPQKKKKKSKKKSEENEDRDGLLEQDVDMFTSSKKKNKE